jgi:hypothetical protein
MLSLRDYLPDRDLIDTAADRSGVAFHLQCRPGRCQSVHGSARPVWRRRRRMTRARGAAGGERYDPRRRALRYTSDTSAASERRYTTVEAFASRSAASVGFRVNVTASWSYARSWPTISRHLRSTSHKSQVPSKVTITSPLGTSVTRKPVRLTVPGALARRTQQLGSPRTK